MHLHFTFFKFNSKIFLKILISIKLLSINMHTALEEQVWKTSALLEQMRRNPCLWLGKNSPVHWNGLQISNMHQGSQYASNFARVVIC